METIDDLDRLTELACGDPDLYLRYSRGPEADASGISRDYEAEVDLPGLPVTTLRPEPWWARDPVDWVARRVCKYLDLARQDRQRRPWVLTGAVVGNGPDHEPLIGDPRPIAWLGDALVAAARHRYREHFDVGRDSND
jgi:hypothetical protein